MQGLSKRQIQICTLIAMAKLDKEIAADLGISFDLVRYHIRRLFKLTGARNRGELMLYILLFSSESKKLMRNGRKVNGCKADFGWVKKRRYQKL
jgi:DNA-binding CsgD family transcriptional regulator